MTDPLWQAVTDIRDWIADRWQTEPMPRPTLDQWYRDLTGRTPEDLWQAVQRHATDQYPPRLPDVLRTLATMIRAEGHSPPRQLPPPTAGTVVTLAAWLQAHNWDTLTDAVAVEHPDDCPTCTQLGVPARPRRRTGQPTCDSGRPHTWGSCDGLDLNDDGWLIVWCSVCGAERHTQPRAA